MPTPRIPDNRPPVNHARGKAHWPIDLELHPDRDEDKVVTHPLNPPPEQRSTRRAQEDERPGS